MASQDFLYDTLRALSVGGVEFVVCGGVACVLQGCNRTTMDLDIALSFDDTNVRKFVAVARSLELRPRAPVPLESFADPTQRDTWIREKGAVVFTVQSDDGLIQVDSFLTYPIPWDLLRANARLAKMDTFQIWVSSIAHLIQAKEAVVPPRPRDLSDIAELKSLL